MQAIAVTAELTQTQLSAPAARVMADDLSIYSEAQVLGALTQCRKGLTGRLTIAAVVTRLADGRPDPEGAWAMIPRDEAKSVVWTDEMRAAWAVALPLLTEGENVPARMAFLEAYRGEVQRARDVGTPVRWEPSLGHDPHGRDAVLLEALEKGRLGAAHVRGLLSHRSEETNERLQAILDKSMKKLGVPIE